MPIIFDVATSWTGMMTDPIPMCIRSTELTVASILNFNDNLGGEEINGRQIPEINKHRIREVYKFS